MENNFNKPRKKRKLPIILGIIVIIIMASIIYGKVTDYLEEKEKRSVDLVWGEGGLWDLLPEPVSTKGEASYESEDSLSIDVYDDKNAYNEYVKACEEAGFTVDFSKSDSYYSGDNAEGYHLSLSYNEDESYDISLNAPEEESEAAEASDNTETQEPEKESNATENADSSNETNASSSSSTSDGVTPEFKEAMDSYEAFFDEYCEFMKSYSDSSDPISMMGDYADYMTQYAETMEKLEEIEDDEMSDADAAYYLEVSGRIMQKLAEVVE